MKKKRSDWLFLTDLTQVGGEKGEKLAPLEGWSTF